MYKFANPYYLLLIIPVLIIFIKPEHRGSIKVASVNAVRKKVKKSRKHLISRFFMMLSLITMVIALARPQLVKTNNKVKKEGIDIVISLDLSKSMLQDDFTPNRLEVAKYVIEEFIKNRTSDRIGLVIFGGEAYTKVPLTFDHKMLINSVRNLDVNDITNNNQTAIGMGIGVGLNRIKESTSKSKIVILLTDGENNSGVMSPEGAMNIAKEMDVKVYTIGIGAYEIKVNGFFRDRMVKNTGLDENLLQKIADTTGGEYYRASDIEEFKNIFKAIDSLEKTKIETNKYYEREEYYEKLLRIALILLLIGIMFEYLVFLRIP